MPHGGIGRGHVVEAMHLFDRPGQCAAHDQHITSSMPSSRLAQITVARNTRQRLGIRDHGVEELVVEVLVISPRAAPGAGVCLPTTRSHVEIAGETIYRLADCLAQREANAAEGAGNATTFTARELHASPAWGWRTSMTAAR